MRFHRLVVNKRTRQVILVATSRREQLEHAVVDLVAPVQHDDHLDLFPPVLAPALQLVAQTEVGDVLHHPVHGAGKQDVVLVVHGDADDDLGLPAVLGGPQSVPFSDKVVGLSGTRGISHIGELAKRQLGDGQHLLQFFRNRVFKG